MMRTRPSLPDIPRNNVLLDFVTKEMLPGGEQEGRESGETSDFDFSPLTPSDQRVAVGAEEEEEQEEEDDEQYGGGEGDACSLDEGLGDLSDSDMAECSVKEAVIRESACDKDPVEVMRPESEQIVSGHNELSSSFVEKSGEFVPPLPEADPPSANVEEKERKPSRIPKLIQNIGSLKNEETNQEGEPEKGSREADGITEKPQDKERAFSPERRPSRISFETML